MNITSIAIKNIGILKDVTIEVNNPLIAVFGEPKQGKSTILKAAKWVFGGEVPEDIIRHGCQEASIKVGLNDPSWTAPGYAERTFYRAADGSTKSRAVTLVMNGEVKKRPSDEIKKILNPFLIDQDHFVKMSDTARTKFLAELLGVDTSDIDKVILETEKKASDQRVKIKAYGNIDTAPVEDVDVDDLKKKKDVIVDAWRSQKEAVEKHNDAARPINNKRERVAAEIDSVKAEIERLTERAKNLAGWLVDNPDVSIDPIPEMPDTHELDEAISNAKAQKLRFTTYLENKKRAQALEDDKALLRVMEESVKEARIEKKSLLFSISESCPIEGLGFNEEGDIVFENTHVSMLSTSQNMRLSSACFSVIGKAIENGLNLEIIDRAESLGRSIWEFTEKAEKENLTILAAIVGQASADIPENVGVFVVENGEIQNLGK